MNESPALWPLHRVIVSTERLELRTIDQGLGEQLALLTDRGIHEPGALPFASAWSAEATPGRYWSSIQFQARQVAELRPDSWQWVFAVSLRDGELIGTQSIMTKQYPVSRSFETGSWIVQERQRQGYGREMRAALLALMFGEFGAEEATTAAWADNEKSAGVSLGLGYVDNGVERRAREDGARELKRYRMTRQVWEASGHAERIKFEATGIDADVRTLLGLAK